MEQVMREHGIPLYALESFRPVRDFDLLGFSLQTELLCTNALLMLELAGVPLLSAERGPGDPIVIAGGPSTVNPEPMAEFIDLFLIGDGEESVVRLLELVREMKGRGGATALEQEGPSGPGATAFEQKAARGEIIRNAARHVPGAYAPALYEASYGADGLLAAVRPVSEGLPERISAARVGDLEAAHVPLQPIVPFVETVHDRITLEIMRGCPHGCRFCQAAMVSRPVRMRSADALVEAARATYAATGHGEIALCSLSSSDYPRLPALLERLTEAFSPLGVSLSLPSLRVSDQLDLLVGPLSSVRKSGLTLAPEAASERLRGVINKKVTDEELLSGTAAAVREGWRVIKLYFMLGLPTETREDVLAIPELCRRLLRSAARESSGRGLKVNVTLSPFVPKPHTPFQSEPMASLEAIKEKLALVLDNTRTRKVRYKAHLAERSVVEALLARGDRRLGMVLRRVLELGGMFDAWDEHFSFDRWTQALEDCGIRWDDPAEPNSPFRERGTDEVLPWDHIDCRVKKAFLLAERERALIEP
ncbi:MAG: radical SAM protein, partial [Candidatus Brocadiia bacterium]|nr:radical SAM protein [Candidatus Brocadiia bacterium]